MKNTFKYLSVKDWAMYIASLIVVIGSNLIFRFDLLNLIGTIIGVTSLIFIAKGNVVGQMFSVLFCFIYSTDVLSTSSTNA